MKCFEILISSSPPPLHSSFNSKEIYNNFKSRLFALNWIISTTHEMWTERHLTGFPPLDLRFVQIWTKNSSRARRTETSGRLLTFSLSQHNATDEVIGGRYPRTTARLFAPWEFSEYSNECRVRDTVVAFPCLFARFRDQLIDDALLCRSIQAHLIFTCIAIQQKVPSFQTQERGQSPSVVFSFTYYALTRHNFE